MQLEFYGLDLKGGKTGNPYPHVYIAKAGRFIVGQPLLEKIEWKEGDRILFANTKLNRKVWYILIDGRGFVLYKVRPNENTRRFNCIKLQLKLFRCFNVESNCLRLYVKPIDVYHENIKMWELTPNCPQGFCKSAGEEEG